MSQVELTQETGAETTPPEVIVGSSVIGVPIALTAVRCTLQYILVPFVLPLFSVGGAFSPFVNLLAGAFGLGVIFYNLKRLWSSNWRWRYLGLSAIVVPIVLVSMYFDFLAWQAF